MKEYVSEKMESLKEKIGNGVETVKSYPKRTARGLFEVGVCSLPPLAFDFFTGGFFHPALDVAAGAGIYKGVRDDNKFSYVPSLLALAATTAPDFMEVVYEGSPTLNAIAVGTKVGIYCAAMFGTKFVRGLVGKKGRTKRKFEKEAKRKAKKAIWEI